MSNASLRYPSGESSASKRSRREHRRSVLADVVRVLGRGWHTRRISTRARRGKLAELAREERSILRRIGWNR